MTDWDRESHQSERQNRYKEGPGTPDLHRTDAQAEKPTKEVSKGGGSVGIYSLSISQNQKESEAWASSVGWSIIRIHQG